MGGGGPDGPGPLVVGGRAGWRGGPGEGECAFAPATPTRNQLGAWDGSLRLVKLPERLAGQGSWPVGIVEMEGIGFRERELPRPQPSRFPRFLRAADSVSAACCERPSTPRRGARLHSLPHRPCAPAGVLGWLLTPPPPLGAPRGLFRRRWALGGRRGPHGPGVQEAASAGTCGHARASGKMP